MDIKSILVEKFFIILIVVYLVLIFRFRWRIMRSRFFQRHYMRLETAAEDARRWFRRLTFFKALRILLCGALAVALIVGGYTVYARLDPDKRFHRLINQCDDLAKKEQYEEAVIDMLNALKIKPDYVKGHYFLAVLYMKQNEIDKAEAALRQVIHYEVGYQDSIDKLEAILLEKQDSKGLFILADTVKEKRPVQSRMIRARGFLLEKKPDEALKELEEADKVPTTDHRVFQLMGNVYMLMGRIVDAEKAIGKSIELNFGNWEAHYALAGIYLEKKNIEAAQAELRASISLNPDFTPPAITLAMLHYGKGENNIALQLLENIISKNEKGSEALYTLALVYAAIGRYQEAVNLFTKLPDEYHVRKNFRYNLALACYHTEKYYESIKWLSLMVESKQMDIPGIKLLAKNQSVLGLYEDSVKTLELLEGKRWLDRDDQQLLAMAKASASASRRESGKIRSSHDALEEYLRKKDYDSLIQGSKKAIVVNKIKAPFYNLLGVAYLATGSIEEAKKSFTAAYNERKDNPAPLKNLVNVYLREGKLNEAENLLKDHNRLFPTETETRMILGNLYFLTGKTDQARALFQRVSELAPAYYEPYQRIAFVSGNKGEIDSAVKYYKKAIELNPNDAISLNDLAGIYAGTDQKDTLALAEQYALKAKKLMPQNGRIIDTLGWIKYRKGDLKEALGLFEEAYRLNPHLANIPYHIGIIQFDLKNYVEAEKNLNLALNMKGHFREAERRGAKEILLKVSSLLKDSDSEKN
jgi:tetratricopeptide (TPR) repeat protein